MSHAQLSGLLSAIAALGAFTLNFTPWFTVGFGGEGIYVKGWAKVVLWVLMAVVVVAVVFLFLPETA